jgi:hypothetical protein
MCKLFLEYINMVTVAKVSASLCKSDIVWLNNKTVQTGLGLGLWCLTPYNCNHDITEILLKVTHKPVTEILLKESLKTNYLDQ